MADNNDILKAIEPIKSDVGNIKKDMATKSDLQEVKQAQAQTNTTLTQTKTTVEALEAGQEDIREKMATKADIHRLEQNIDKVDKHIKSHESRIENIKEDAGIPNPHKN